MRFKVTKRSGMPTISIFCGTEGMVDMKKFVHAKASGIFHSLQDTRLFNQASCVLGVVTWPGGLDLAPDRIYQAIQAHGIWQVQP